MVLVEDTEADMAFLEDSAADTDVVLAFAFAQLVASLKPFLFCSFNNTVYIIIYIFNLKILQYPILVVLVNR